MWRTSVCWVMFVAVLSLALASGAQAQDPNMLGWWPLSIGSGDMAFDVSGNGMDGTIYNPTAGLGVDGAAWVEDAVRGTVFSSDGLGTGAYIRAGSIPQMTLENDFTWAFWAKQDGTNTADNDIIVGNRYDENAVDFSPRQFIKFTPTKFEWHMNGNGDDNMDYEGHPGRCLAAPCGRQDRRSAGLLPQRCCFQRRRHHAGPGCELAALFQW